MEKLQEFKCPCCDGAIEFDSKTQKMKCPYCDTELEIEAVKAYNEEMATGAESSLDWNTEVGEEWQEGELDGLRVYACESCGGEIVGDATTGATTCPFCGNAVVIKGMFSGALKPDLVIPFKLDKKAAKEALRRHYDKRLVPKLFKKENRINEVKGVYVPFWLFDAKADAKMRYRATRVRFWSDRYYNYTATSHYLVLRSGNLGFEGVPVDGSEKMDDTLMESIEPFNLSEAVDFETAYLAGYFADKYDVSAEDSVERANDRVKQSTADAFASTVMGYQSVRPVSTSIRLKDGRARYALYPVWLLNTTWNGKKYTFAMNGQTGKLIGDLPMNKKAFAGWLFGVSAVCSAAAFGLSYLLWMWL